MSNETVFIQQLLAAEKRAKEVIESARKSRMPLTFIYFNEQYFVLCLIGRIKRIHQAQTEAKEEIESIRQELEKKFQVYESECIRSSNEISHKIKQETMQYLRQMIRDASKNRQAVINKIDIFLGLIIELIFLNFVGNFPIDRIGYKRSITIS